VQKVELRTYHAPIAHDLLYILLIFTPITVFKLFVKVFTTNSCETLQNVKFAPSCSCSSSTDQTTAASECEICTKAFVVTASIANDVHTMATG
jgi:hypothetical protein